MEYSQEGNKKDDSGSFGSWLVEYSLTRDEADVACIGIFEVQSTLEFRQSYHTTSQTRTED